MPTQIELLAALQTVDRSLRQKEQAVEESESRVAALEEARSRKSAEAAAAREGLAALTARERELEERLAATERKLKDRRMRITRIRNDKELGLAKREVDLLKEEASAIETELLGVLEQVKAATEKLRVAEEELAAVEGRLAAEAAGLRERIDVLGGEIARERASRDALLGTVDADLRRRYEMIFARRGGLAVVEVRAGTCQGCHMNVPPQLFNQIQRNEQVILCPNCQRMLYWRPEREEGASG